MMKKKLMVLCLFPFMMFANQEVFEKRCSKETLVKTLCAYKKIKDFAIYDSDAVKRGIQCFQVGCMLVEHPVAKLVGAILELASVGIDAYEMFSTSSIPEAVIQEIEYHDIFLPERFYFEIMRKKLTDVKKEFIDVRNVVCEYYTLNDFEIMFDPFALTISQEATYNDLQKKHLRYAREKELHQLEHDIIDLQFQIILHISNLIEARSKSFFNVNKVFEYVSNERSAIKNSLHDYTKDQLVDLYVKEMYLEKIMNEYKHYNAKLLLAINFFKQPMNASVIKQTSNIMEIISRIESDIVSSDFLLFA